MSECRLNAARTAGCTFEVGLVAIVDEVPADKLVKAVRATTIRSIGRGLAKVDAVPRSAVGGAVTRFPGNLSLEIAFARVDRLFGFGRG